MALAIAGILALTLVPDAGPILPVRCLWCADRFFADVLRNVILFIPFGMAAGSPRRGALAVASAAALLSGAIELTQVLIPGRASSLFDLVANTTGGLAGHAVARRWRDWLGADGARARRLALVTAAGASLVLAVSAALLAPAFPRSLWFGQWTPHLSRLDVYDGRVLSATLGTSALPSHDLRHSDRVRAGLLAGDSLRVLMVVGSHPSGLAPIFAIADDQPREVLLLGEYRGDLVFRYRSRARALRLEQPDLRITGGLAGRRTGDTVRLGVDRVGPLACPRVDARVECPRLGTGSGWALVVAQSMVPAPLRAGMDVGWIMGLLMPAGFFAAAGGTVAGPLLAAGSLVLAPWAADLGAPRLRDLLAGAAGLGLGTALAWARLRARSLRPS